jgi:hypothetical protein
MGNCRGGNAIRSRGWLAAPLVLLHQPGGARRQPGGGGAGAGGSQYKSPLFLCKSQKAKAHSSSLATRQPAEGRPQLQAACGPEKKAAEVTELLLCNRASTSGDFSPKEGFPKKPPRPRPSAKSTAKLTKRSKTNFGRERSLHRCRVA